MTITDSRLKGGTLTFTVDAAPLSFASQATNVRLIPKTDEDGDPLEVLSGDTIEADDVTSWTLNMTAVQDFDDPDGFIGFALANAGDVVAFTWKPNAAGVSYGGTVKVRPVEIGGDVNARNTTGAEWPLVGDPTPTYPPAP